MHDRMNILSVAVCRYTEWMDSHAFYQKAVATDSQNLSVHACVSVHAALFLFWKNNQN